MSRPLMLAETVTTRSWFLRSTSTGPRRGCTRTTFRRTTGCPSALVTVRSSRSRRSIRSASLTWTRIRYSPPASRKSPARVPEMMVWSMPAICETVSFRSAAFWRSTMTSSSGVPVSRLS